jgi:hypothetical protein
LKSLKVAGADVCVGRGWAGTCGQEVRGEAARGEAAYKPAVGPSVDSLILL